MSVLDLGEQDKAAVFQGGNYVDLHQMLGVRSGTEVLYVGDHIYGDILRSKKVRRDANGPPCAVKAWCMLCIWRLFACGGACWRQQEV